MVASNDGREDLIAGLAAYGFTPDDLYVEDALHLLMTANTTDDTAEAF